MSEMNDTSCSICLNNELSEINTVQLQCGHKFCMTCIFEWLYSDKENKKYCNCPFCRQPIKINKFNKQQIEEYYETCFITNGNKEPLCIENSIAVYITCLNMKKR